MLWEAAAYAVLGLIAAYAATRMFPSRFRPTSLVLATGPAGALTGGLVSYAVLGGGHPEVTLPVALLTAAAILSVLAQPVRRGRHAKIRSAT
jgi:hypothetical protein